VYKRVQNTIKNERLEFAAWRSIRVSGFTRRSGRSIGASPLRGLLVVWP